MLGGAIVKAQGCGFVPQNMLGKYSAIDICPGFGGFGSGPNLPP